MKHIRSCHLCEAICGIEVEYDAGRILSIRPDPDDPLSLGHLCPKALALPEVQDDPDRLRTPIRRTPDGWQSVEWDEAFELATSRLGDIRRDHGPDAVALYVGNPSVHIYGTTLFALPFIAALGTRNRYSATSVDQLPRMLASFLMYGNRLLLPVPDIDRTDLLLVLGANPLVSNGSLMTAPGVGRRIAAIKERGGEVVVVDPRRTETAAVATRHISSSRGRTRFSCQAEEEAERSVEARSGAGIEEPGVGERAFQDRLPLLASLLGADRLCEPRREQDGRHEQARETEEVACDRDLAGLARLAAEHGAAAVVLGAFVPALPVVWMSRRGRASSPAARSNPWSHA